MIGRVGTAFGGHGITSRPHRWAFGQDEGEAVMALTTQTAVPQSVLDEIVATDGFWPAGPSRSASGRARAPHRPRLVVGGRRTVAACPPLEGQARADVAIVGGGFTGLWAAWQVLERAPGARVAILDATICARGRAGATAASSTISPMRRPRLRAIAGDASARRTVEASIEAIGAIGRWCAEQEVDAWFRPGGQIVASAAPDQDGASDEAIAACRALGLDGALVPMTDEEVHARCDAPPLRGGTFVPDTATIQPARLGAGCAGGCSSAAPRSTSALASPRCATVVTA